MIMYRQAKTMKNVTSGITEEEIPEGVRLILRGRVNSENADNLHEIMQKALENGRKYIILNMMRVNFLSSSGIRVILKTYQDVKKIGGSLVIELPSDNVKNVLGMTALDDMLIKNES